MAEKTVAVRLKAVVDDYKRAMATAADATASVAQKADAWKNLGKSTSDLGDRMTRNLTLPIIAVGAAAVKMSMDFDNAFVQMQTLAGVSADEVEGLKESVLGLAGETGRAPQELAEALYFIQSAGIGGEAALQALEASAKGASAGLGSTIQVADAVTNAINGYGAANITASQATDVLIATAREGKAEASELAPQFGRLIPIAAELGITFDQVGGGLAFLTRASGDTSLAATQLSGVMAKLLEPGVEGTDALARAGMSADDLRRSVREKGLHQALLDLRENLESSGQELSDFSIDAQFLQGALQLTGASAQEAEEIFAALEDSAGATDDAFAKWAESMGAENAQAWAKMQAALIQFGDAIAPIASKVMSFLGDLASAFSDLPGPVQTAVIGLLAFLAALGPILSTAGRIITVYGTLQKAIDAFGTRMATQAAAGFNQMGTASGTAASGMSRLASALGKVGLAIAALYAFGKALDAIDPRHAANLSELENSMLDFIETGRSTGELASIVGDDFGKLRDAIEGIAAPSVGTQLVNVGDEIGSLGGLLGDGVNDLEQYRQTVDDLDKSLANLASRSPEEATAFLRGLREELRPEEYERVRGMLNDYDTALAEIDTAARTAEGGIEGATGALDEQATAVEVVEQALQGYLDTLNGLFDPLFGYADALAGNRDANAALAEAQTNLNTAIADHGPNSLEAMAATFALSDAQRAAGESALGVASAEASLKAAIEAGTVSVDQAKNMLQQWVASGLITQATADALAADFDNYAAHVNSIPGHHNTDLTTSGLPGALNSVSMLRNALDTIPRNVVVNVSANVRGVGAIAAATAAANRRQHGGRVSAHMPYLVGEAGEEVFVPDMPGTVIPNHLLGSMTPTAVALAGGASETHVHLYMQGAIVSSQTQFDRMVVRALRRAGDAGMPITIRGRRV
jgi:TP901 family phage tail tape measure protein